MNALTSIQLKIKDTLEKYESLKVISSHVNEIEISLKDSYDKMKILDKRLDKELKDIEDLEKIGVKSLFYKTLGNKEAQLEKERQEYLGASLKYKELKQRIELQEYERGILAKKITQLPLIKKNLDDLKSKRETEILSSSDSNLQNEFRKLLNQLDTLNSFHVELQEAIREGEKGKELLVALISFLKKAKDWGRWDMYSKDRHTKYMKHRAIDNAVKVLTTTQHQLSLFSRELRDINENSIEFNLDVGDFKKFSDFFFDNLISDWIVQQRIKSSLHNIVSTNDHVSELIRQLSEELQIVDNEISIINKKKDELLLTV